MTAQSVDTFVVAFSDPDGDFSKPWSTRINASISFELINNGRIRTLSTNTAVDGDVQGLLYVPDLDPSDPCANASRLHVPNNVTRIGNLPSGHYPYVAFAPWISAICAKSYLAASAVGTTGFLTYLPDLGTDTPPLANDEVWNLHDGGQWKAQNQFPVYAIPGSDGSSLMQQSSQYSGNSSNAGLAGMLAQAGYQPTDYVRLYTAFGIRQPTKMAFWAFLLMAFGITLLVLCLISLLMHWVQRRGRRDLRRRVENGEVDLEALGIKRLRISQEVIDSLQTSTYTQHKDSPNNLDMPEHPPAKTPAEQSAPPSPPTDHSRYSQPTCPICLEDFIPNATTIRSLPCHHIYHPTCIDPFLRNRSSLCPVCKAPVLPPNSKQHISGRITNHMVRQERRLRRAREAGGVQERSASGADGASGRWTASLRRGYARGRRAFSAPAGLVAAPTSNEIEMGAVAQRAVSEPMAVEGSGSGSPPAEVGSSTEWMRRVRTLRGNERTVDDEETGRLARLPRWRKAIGAMFPGFR